MIEEYNIETKIQSERQLKGMQVKARLSSFIEDELYEYQEEKSTAEGEKKFVVVKKNIENINMKWEITTGRLLKSIIHYPDGREIREEFWESNLVARKVIEKEELVLKSHEEYKEGSPFGIHERYDSSGNISTKKTYLGNLKDGCYNVENWNYWEPGVKYTLTRYNKSGRHGEEETYNLKSKVKV